MVRPNLHRLDGGLHRGVRGEHDDEDVRVVLLDATQHGDAVHVGQAVVEQDQVHAVAHTLECVAAGFRLEHVMPLGAQAFEQRPPDQLLVIDDENCGVRHRGSLFKQRLSACRAALWRIRRQVDVRGRDLLVAQVIEDRHPATMQRAQPGQVRRCSATGLDDELRHRFALTAATGERGSFPALSAQRWDVAPRRRGRCDTCP